MGRGKGRARPGIEIQHLVADDKQRKEKVGNTTIRDLQRQYGDNRVIVAEAFMRVGVTVFTDIGNDKHLDTAERLDA